MSSTDDRIKVPTNGHRRGLDDPVATTAARTSSASAAPTPSPTPESARLSASPTQLAVGFGAIAGLILILIGARRRRG